MSELTHTSTPEHKSPTDFHEEIAGILQAPLDPKYVDTFADDALGKIINLAEEAIESYNHQPTIAMDDRMGLRQNEEAAFRYYELEDIEGILDSISDMSGRIRAIDTVIQNATKTDKIIAAPVEPGNAPLPASGEGAKRRTIPRLKTVLLIAQESFSIDLNDTDQPMRLREGARGPDMMRKHPYYLVELPELSRTILVCDEEGNATFVFDNSKMQEHGININYLMSTTKQEFNDMSEDPDLVAKVNYHKQSFSRRITHLLENPLHTEAGPESEQGEITLLPSTPQEGEVHFSALARRLGVSRPSLTKYLKELNIHGVLRKPVNKARGGHNKITLYYGEDQQKALEDKISELQLPPEGYKIISEVAETLDRNREAINKWRQALGIELETFRHPSTGKEAKYFSPEDINKLREYEKGRRRKISKPALERTVEK